MTLESMLDLISKLKEIKINKYLEMKVKKMLLQY